MLSHFSSLCLRVENLCNLHSNGNGEVEQLKANLEVENSPAKFLSVNGHVMEITSQTL